MRLDFNVLWVEDQPHNVKTQQERIESQIRKEGFRLQVVPAQSVDQAKKFLSDQIYGDHIDLVLMDYDLGAGQKGSEGLVEVRNIFHYKDIIFYSAGQNAKGQNIVDLVPHGVQGVFCSSREDLANTVEGVFESLVKKVLDIDHSRGIVMGATSDIDHYVYECLVSSFDIGTDDQKKIVRDNIQARIQRKRDDFEAGATKIAAVQHVSELLDHHYTYTSMDRLELFKKLLKQLNLHTEYVPYIEEYVANTVPKRNDLAHLQVRVEGFSRKLFDRKGQEMTSAQMRELRQELLKIQEHFEVLFQKLKPAS